MYVCMYVYYAFIYVRIYAWMYNHNIDNSKPPPLPTEVTSLSRDVHKYGGGVNNLNPFHILNPLTPVLNPPTSGHFSGRSAI